LSRIGFELELVPWRITVGAAVMDSAVPASIEILQGIGMAEDS